MKSKIDEKVTEILSVILRIPLDENASKTNVSQWDSLKHIEIVFALEDAFGTSFTVGQVEKMTSVRAIIQELKNNEA
jgi:acyl carrier protein